ncbi:uncharacterized protein BDZ99DRAFT_536843 [Mytilinidion resinicola]|uniref:Gfd2/YDR514C-like C-terminal domain-containing protein n=1 Tax=Mytilinidion resinicola TaxID=574789 RepID=A0A6A6YFM0_9PEZI|nr:uncharacterized protein BDZ99DRAFT_536843 [Mytilinidion resinicola]KAF2807368.1 hypothetical protein BDZ99DRAFT_536843 [Mytilinidion resinicola]
MAEDSDVVPRDTNKLPIHHGHLLGEDLLEDDLPGHEALDDGPAEDIQGVKTVTGYAPALKSNPLPRVEAEKLLEVVLGLKFPSLGPSKGGIKRWSSPAREDFAKAHPDIAHNAVFVSIDFESLSWMDDTEHPEYGKITELGLAFLDTRALKGVTSQTNWVEEIRAKHYIVDEYAHLRPMVVDKRKHSLANADKFDYGASEIVPFDALGNILKNALRIPDDAASAAGKESMEVKYRPIILVAHAYQNEDNYQRSELGLSDADLDVLYAIIDTQVMMCGRGQKAPGLRQLLETRFGIHPVNMHNAGNDAVYTLVLVLARVAKKGYGVDEKSDVADKWLDALKIKIAEEAGGRCENCGGLGHLDEACEEPKGAGLHDVAKALARLRLDRDDAVQEFERTACAPPRDAEPTFGDEPAEPTVPDAGPVDDAER